MKRFAIALLGAAMLSGCASLLTVPVGPSDHDPNSRYDKTVDTQTVRDCLSGKDDQSSDPNCFYQKRDRKDEAEQNPPQPPYGHSQ